MVQATAEQSRKNSNFIVDCFMYIITLSIMKLKFNTYIHFIACIIRNIYQLTHLIISQLICIVALQQVYNICFSLDVTKRIFNCADGDKSTGECAW